LFATSVGEHGGDDRLPKVGASDLERRAASDRRFLDELASLDASTFSLEERISAALLERQLRERVASFEQGAWQLPFTSESGFHVDFAQLPRGVPLLTVADHERYLARLGAWPAMVDQQIENARQGIRRGMVQPRVSIEGFETTMSSHDVARAEDSVFWAPFARLPASVSATDRSRLEDTARRVIVEQVAPAYRRLHHFFVDEYLPAARPTIAASDLPGGRDYYAQRVRWYTTLDLDPDQVHEIGLAEVARIEVEMASFARDHYHALRSLDVGAEDGGALVAIVEAEARAGDTDAPRTIRELIDRLRSDRRFYTADPDDLLRRAAWIAKRADGKLPRLFRTLPRVPYTVEPVPEHMAPKYTSARYVPPPYGGVEPGIYWVNIYKPETRPLFNLTALTLHEAVPGHHLQGSLANELESLPPFRRFDYIDAYGEGWGLYAEWLGIEMGMYEDPWSDFGRLGYEMWRACRLVVDTGMHAKGWTREQAIDYMAARTSLPLIEVRTEIDRYITWPGQALAYKMGEIELRKQRARAESALRERFDVREFHDAVLSHGSVTLPLLGEIVDDYVARAQ
jgi:uncharacterized protein (DUF885 family)